MALPAICCRRRRIRLPMAELHFGSLRVAERNFVSEKLCRDASSSVGAAVGASAGATNRSCRVALALLLEAKFGAICAHSFASQMNGQTDKQAASLSLSLSR